MDLGPPPSADRLLKTSDSMIRAYVSGGWKVTCRAELARRTLDALDQMDLVYPSKDADVVAARLKARQFLTWAMS